MRIAFDNKSKEKFLACLMKVPPSNKEYASYFTGLTVTAIGLSDIEPNKYGGVSLDANEKNAIGEFLSENNCRINKWYSIVIFKE